MKERKDDFLEHIKKTLEDYEPPYEQGAWERFSEKNKKKAAVLFPMWRWAAAAAVIGVLLFSGYAIFLNNKLNDKPLTKTETTAGTDKKIAPNSTEIEANNDITKTAHTPLINATTSAKHIVPINTNNNIPQNKINTIHPIIIEQTTQEKTVKTETQKTEEKQFWENKVIEEKSEIASNNTGKTLLSVQPTESKKSKGNKWNSSFFLSPNINDLGVNVGFGYSIAYAVNSKVKITSGIAYARNSTSKSFSMPTALNDYTVTNSDIGANASAGIYRSVFSAPSIVSAGYLQSVEGSISGFDIPLELSYSLNDKLYVSGGVSGFVVIDDSRKYTFADNRNQRVTVENNGQIVENKAVTLNDATTTSIPLNANTINDKTDFLGYYNLSVGYQQKIFKKNSVSIEPFIKVPMKTITDQKLNYLGTGIKVKFDF